MEPAGGDANPMVAFKIDERVGNRLSDEPEVHLKSRPKAHQLTHPDRCAYKTTTMDDGLFVNLHTPTSRVRRRIAARQMIGGH